jgi:hypothetical protein
VHLLPTSTEAPGGHVTGGEVMAFDSKWKQIGYGEIKNGKMELAK